MGFHTSRGRRDDHQRGGHVRRPIWVVRGLVGESIFHRCCPGAKILLSLTRAVPVETVQSDSAWIAFCCVSDPFLCFPPHAHVHDGLVHVRSSLAQGVGTGCLQRRIEAEVIDCGLYEHRVLPRERATRVHAPRDGRRDAVGFLLAATI